jgi:predicted enzyme related to lactoylglutathione lyase
MAKNNTAKKLTTPSAAPKAAHRPGAFTWLELRTSDVAKTARILGEVVGWNISTMPMPPEAGGDYTLASSKSGPVAGIVPLEKGAHAHAIAYVSVDDVDGALQRVVKAGGKALSAAFDVPTIGRMVEVADPEGATFFLFKSESGDAELAPANGNVLWNELWATNDKKQVAFFTSVFGYSVDAMDMGGAPYHVLKTKSGAQAGGVMSSPVPGLPAHFLQYLHVDDVEAACARAKKHGCAIDGDVQDVPGIGRFAFVRTDEGLRFAVMTPAAR